MLSVPLRGLEPEREPGREKQGCPLRWPSELLFGSQDMHRLARLGLFKTSDSLRRIEPQDLLLKTDKNSETSAMRFKPALTAWEYSH